MKSRFEQTLIAVSAVLSQVNWYEIAEHFISDCDQTITEDDDYDNAIDHPLPFLEDVLGYASSQIFAKAFPRDVRSLARLDVKRAIARVMSEVR